MEYQHKMLILYSLILRYSMLYIIYIAIDSYSSNMFQANRTYEYLIQRGLANKVLEIAPRRAQIERSRLRGSQPQLYCHSRVSEGIVHLELRGQDL